MRKITARQKQILKLLLGRKSGMTAAEIAADIGVSVRTVHREMDEIEQLLSYFGLVLHRKSGTGISIWSDSEESDEGKKIQEARRLLLVDNPVEYTGEERKIILLCDLLEEQEPYKLFALAHGLKVTVTTVSSDLDELQPWVEKFGLDLVRRRGYGVEIVGDEMSKRLALCQLAFDHLDYSDFIGGTQNNQNPAVATRLLDAIGAANLLIIENTLWEMNWEWTEHISEKAYTLLLINLSLTVKRMQNGQLVSSAAERKQSEVKPENSEATADFADRLGEKLEMQFPPDEIKYMCGLFSEAKEPSPELVHADLELADMVNKLTANVVKRTDIPFQDDRILRSGLLEHMNSALLRLREGARIRNPLLGAIKKDYEELFTIVRESMDEIHGDFPIPDEEIGFLVMHFGASLARLNQFSGNVRAILVCSSGLSSSKMLASRLAKEMPQIEVLGNVSWYEAARLPEEDYDLIISTIDLPLPADRYVRLSPLLTEEDKERLLHYVQQTTLKTRKPAAEEESAKTNAYHRVRVLSAVLNEIVSLLDQFVVMKLDNVGFSLYETIIRSLEIVNQTFALANAADDPLHPKEANPAISDVEAVTSRLLEREKMASQVIPGTSLALFHTRSRFVAYRSLTLFRLKEPVVMDGKSEINAILFMLAPRELSRESLEVLSEISAMLLKPELVELLEMGERLEIRNFLAAELMLYYENNKHMNNY